MARAGVLRHHIPLIDRDDHAFMLIYDEARDVRILGSHAVVRIYHQDGDFGPLYGELRSQHAVLFDAHVDTTPAADARRVDHHELTAAELERHVYSIARCAG